MAGFAALPIGLFCKFRSINCGAAPSIRALANTYKAWVGKGTKLPLLLMRRKRSQQ